ncbi:MAG: tetratricopeptide repeat protein [Acidobacteriota bacterium]
MSKLPVLEPKNRIRRSRSTRWRATLLILVHVVIAAHITHWLVRGRTITPVEPSEAAALATSGVVNAGLVFFAVTIVLTAIFGRFFCGWGCHLVALQDLSRALLEKFGRKPKPLRSRLLIWVPPIAFVYAFLWPAIYRLWAGLPMPSIRFEFTTEHFWATFPGWFIGGLTFVICGFLAIYFLGAKGFCAYACPYGAIFGAAERLSPMRIRVTDACAACGHCTAVCTSNVRVHEEVRDFGMVVDSGCMKCLDCVSVCPNGALYYGFGPLPWAVKPKNSKRKARRPALSWVEEGVAAGAFVAAFFTFRGLYGEIPFLMALGLSGVLAFLVLLCAQLLTRANLSFKGWSLKRGGKLQRPALGLLAGMTLFGVFWVHSGIVRYHTYRGDAGYRTAKAWETMLLDVVSTQPLLAEEDERSIERGYESFERVRELGLIGTRGLNAKMAWQAALLERGDAVERHAELAIERGDLASDMHQLVGREAYEARDLPGALSAFEKAVAVNPDDLWARINLGVVQTESGDLQAAQATFETAQREFGDTVTLAYNLGLVAAYSGRFMDAAGPFARAVELDSRHLPARENLAGMLATMGRLEEALEHYLMAIEMSPNDAQTRLLAARVLDGLGRRDEALEQVREALRLAPGMPEAKRLEAELSGLF